MPLFARFPLAEWELHDHEYQARSLTGQAQAARPARSEEIDPKRENRNPYGRKYRNHINGRDANADRRQASRRFDRPAIAVLRCAKTPLPA